MNRCFEERDKLEWMTKGKTTLIHNELHKKTPHPTTTDPTLNVPTDDVKNTNGTNQGGNLLLDSKSRTIRRRTERMPQKNKRNRSTVH